ncbi:MAG TPA: UDP-3-O-acyl-N-acetylglucosamine deacetylase [Myxococcaceae bacterium]|nr:UDP-3-O-acyl-N-acetylglucosamine deacetylase [Myxococcaceae bacterium]
MSKGLWNQRTLATPVGCEGVGLHTGQPVRLRVLPAPVDTGIIFVRTDHSPAVTVPAKSEYVVDTALATSLGRDGARVGTVEHLLSALAGLGIDNARVELDAPEVPILDGSAAPFVTMLTEGGVRLQDAARQMLVIQRAVTVRDGDKVATLAPSDRLRIRATIDFQHPLISDQCIDIALDDGAYLSDISRARTFGFLRDVERLKAAGLARGGSLENAIVVDDFSILNPDGLRFPDEFVRHKVLDAIGDLALLGYPVVGRLEAHKTGHALHHRLVQEVLSDPANYQVVRARSCEGLGLRLPSLAPSRQPVAA